VKTQSLSPTQTATFKIHIENDADRRDKFYIHMKPPSPPNSCMCPSGNCSGVPDAVKAVVNVGRPQMTVAKDDGKTSVVEGDSLPYVVCGAFSRHGTFPVTFDGCNASSV